MPQHKILDIASSFDKKKWTRCKQFIINQFRPNAKERYLFELIHSHRHDLNSEELLPNNVYRSHFNDFKRTTYDKLTSRLCASLESFIVHDEIDYGSYIYERQTILSRYYMRTGLFKHFTKVSMELVKRSNELSEYGLDKRLKLLLTEFELAYSQLGTYDKTSYLNASFRDLVIYTEIMKKLFSIGVKSQNRLFNSDLIEKIDYKEDDLYKFLDKLEKLVVERTDDHFSYLSEKVFQVKWNSSSKFPLIVLLYLVNHCYYKMKRGEEAAQNQLLQLYEKGLVSGLLTSCGPLTEFQYLNIIEAKSNLQSEIDHTSFINHWLDHTFSKDKKNLVKVAMAYMHFGKEEYEECNNYLMIDTKATSINLGLRVRWMRICCLYFDNKGKEKYVSSKTALRSHERYFRRKADKIGKANYEGSLNLLKVVGMFWAEKDKELIRKKVASFEHLIFRFWVQKELKKMSDK